jgi:L-asparaginase
VAVASLGGTITMTPASGGGAVTPSLQAADLVAAVPGLDDVAELSVATLRTDPGAWLTPTDVVAVAEWARGQVTDAGADGVVVVQGTDTIEETAYLLDLYWDRPEPLVVSGAMRAPSAAGADGPANLLAATVVAASPDARDRGALVVPNDEVHAAARVRKTDTVALHAFGSGPFGPVGRVHERTVTFAGGPARWPSLPLPVSGRVPRVALLETHLGDRGDLLRLVARDGYDGVVLAGFGAGHVSAAMAEVVSDVVPRCPVVLASRTGAGPVLTGTYGFVGSEQDLLARGVLPAGWLDARKARLLLWALLAAGEDPEAVRATVTARGRAPGGPPA